MRHHRQAMRQRFQVGNAVTFRIRRHYQDVAVSQTDSNLGLAAQTTQLHLLLPAHSRNVLPHPKHVGAVAFLAAEHRQPPGRGGDVLEYCEQRCSPFRGVRFLTKTILSGPGRWARSTALSR
jgi:hypothetical protein